MTTIVNVRGQDLQTDSATANINTGGAAAGDIVATTTAGKAGIADTDSQPLSPPAPMIGHLTNEEIEALNDVFSRMEMFEAEESARIRYHDVVVVFVVVVVVVVKVFKATTRRPVSDRFSKRRVKPAGQAHQVDTTCESAVLHSLNHCPMLITFLRRRRRRRRYFNAANFGKCVFLLLNFFPFAVHVHWTTAIVMRQSIDFFRCVSSTHLHCSPFSHTFTVLFQTYLCLKSSHLRTPPDRCNVLHDVSPFSFY